MDSTRVLFLGATFLALISLIGANLPIGEIKHYDPIDFHDKVHLSNHFVMFYAPWCPKCQVMNDVLMRIAKKYNKEEDSKRVTIARVDCQAHEDFCQEEDYHAFPTMQLFTRKVSTRGRYRGKHLFYDVDEYLETELNRRTQHERAEKQKYVKHLNERNFEEGIKKEVTYVFYDNVKVANCRDLWPKWIRLGETLKDSHEVSIATVNCTEDKHLCKKEFVERFPTLRIYMDGGMIRDMPETRFDPSILDIQKFLHDYMEEFHELRKKQHDEKVAEEQERFKKMRHDEF